MAYPNSSRVYKAGGIAVRVTDEGRNPSTLADTDIVSAAQALKQIGVSVSEPVTGEVFSIGELSASLWHWIDTYPSTQHAQRGSS